MPSLWEVLKTSKGLPAPDGFTALFAHSLSDTYTLAEISGIPPLNLGVIVEIVDYTIEGNIYQSDGVSPDTPQEVVGCGDFDESTGKYKISVVTRGKNLWYLQSSYSFTTFYDINVNINAGHYLSYIIETNGTTGIYGETGCQLTFSDNTTQYVFFNATYRKSILLSKDVKIVRVYAGKDYNTSVGFTATVSEIMVSANADDSYEPYTPPITTPIYLDSPLYKIGDYADRRGMTEEVRAVKELVLTGNENWQLWNGDYFSSVIDRKGKISNIYCTHFINSNASGISYATNSSAALKIDSSSIPFVSDVSELKAWLESQYTAGTPVKVYYVLAEPETKAVESTEIPTIQGTNIIDINTEVKPSNLKITYKSKM